MNSSKRPFEGQALANILRELAMVSVIADSLGMDLGPLSEEDRAAGAEPLTTEQIKAELKEISRRVTFIALEGLQAQSTEWYAAVDAVEDPDPIPDDGVQRH